MDIIFSPLATPPNPTFGAQSYPLLGAQSDPFTLLGFTNNHNSISNNNSKNKKNYYYNNNCIYHYHNYSSYHNYSCNENNKTNQNTQLYNRQQPTTNNNLQIACQMEDSSSKMLQTNPSIMQNGRFQLPTTASNGLQNGRFQFQFPNAVNSLEMGAARNQKENP